jgi:hypothetical protein
MSAGLIIPKGSLISGISDILLLADSNVTGEANDLVNVQNGELEIVDPGERIAGYVSHSDAIDSDSSDVPVNITPFMQVVMDNDNTGTTFASTHVGEYFDITGGTGAQIVDTSTVTAPEGTGNSGQLVCLEYNPQNVRDDLDSDTSVGLFMIREQQFSTV